MVLTMCVRCSGGGGGSGESGFLSGGDAVAVE